MSEQNVLGQAADRMLAALDRGASPAEVERAVAETAWESVLPPRASNAAWHVSQGVKRALDAMLSLTGLVVFMPAFVVIAVLILIESGRPILYPWRVLGLRGRAFTGYKFRTMIPNADRLKAKLLHLNEMQGPVFKMRDDPRVSRLGRWLRKYSLDELPQLWSVLVGDMSLVGPRPPSAEEFVAFTPEQRRKLAVRPGITCLWQVSGRSGISDSGEWVRLDLQYIRGWNLWLDFVILLKTIPAVLLARGAY